MGDAEELEQPDHPAPHGGRAVARRRGPRGAARRGTCPRSRTSSGENGRRAAERRGGGVRRRRAVWPSSRPSEPHCGSRSGRPPHDRRPVRSRASCRAGVPGPASVERFVSTRASSALAGRDERLRPRGSAGDAVARGLRGAPGSAPRHRRRQGHAGSAPGRGPRARLAADAGARAHCSTRWARSSTPRSWRASPASATSTGSTSSDVRSR